MSTPYTVSFACLNCRRAFKREVNPAQSSLKLDCHNCSSSAYNLGRHFKAPKRTDLQQWKKIEFLLQHGFRFQKIRTSSHHHDTVPYPQTLAQAREFVLKYKQYAVPTGMNVSD